jgi:hypothetical protein
MKDPIHQSGRASFSNGVPAQRWISRSSAVTSSEVFWLGQSPVKIVIDWMSQFDGDRECAIGRDEMMVRSQQFFCPLGFVN